MTSYTPEGFYDWNPILSRLSTADLLMVLGGRSIGKTYGLRKKMISAFISERQEASCAIFRFEKGMRKILSRYFAKHQLKHDARGLEFSVKENAVLASMPEREHGARIVNEPIVYGVALTSSILDKQHTYPNVRYIAFDEAILDRADRFHGYLRNEYEDLINVFSTIAREEPGIPTRCKLILMGNALDFVNPYFAAFGINRIPDYGYHTYRNGAVVLHYVEPREGVADDFAVSRLAPDDEYRSLVFDNSFTVDDAGTAQRPKSADYRFGLRLLDDEFGVWSEGETVYITDEVLDAGTKLTLTATDGTLDYRYITKGSRVMENLMKLATHGNVRYSSISARERFKRVLAFYGLR